MSTEYTAYRVKEISLEKIKAGNLLSAVLNTACHRCGTPADVVVRLVPQHDYQKYQQGVCRLEIEMLYTPVDSFGTITAANTADANKKEK